MSLSNELNLYGDIEFLMQSICQSNNFKCLSMGNIKYKIFDYYFNLILYNKKHENR